MAAYFDVEYSLIALSVPLYLAASTVVQILIGPMSDTLGRRPVIMVSMILFLLTTLGCIFTTNITVFLVLRMAQSFIAMSMVLSRAAIRDMYEGPKAASMIGYVTMGMTIVPMLGPMLGGYIDDIYGWQANFWLLFAVGLVIAIIFWIDFGETARVSGKTLLEQFREYPELLTSPRFWGYSLAAGLTSGSFFAYLGGAPYVGVNVYDLTSSELGINFAAPAVGYFIGNFLSGRYSERFGINAMITWGSIINLGGVGLSLLISIMGLDTAYSFFGFMCFVGLGNGMTISNGTAGAINLRPHLAGTAAGLFSAVMVGASAVMSAAAGWMVGPNMGAAPLLAIMCLSAIGGCVAILAVLRREKHLQAVI